MSATFDFSGKRVFIFGGTSGINLGIARCFASVGANVSVASRSQDKVDAAVAELSALGSESQGYALDVRDLDAVKAALEKHATDGDELDVLVSGAAGNFPAFATGMSANAFKSVVDIDLLGSFHVLQSFSGRLGEVHDTRKRKKIHHETQRQSRRHHRRK